MLKHWEKSAKIFKTVRIVHIPVQQIFFPLQITETKFSLN